MFVAKISRVVEGSVADREPYIRSLNHDPRHEEQGVVVLGVASEAIVICPAAVELSIDRVLQHKPYIASRQPIHLEDIAAGVGAAVRAARHRQAGVIEAVVCVPAGAEVAQRCPILRVVVVGKLALERAQPV